MYSSSPGNGGWDLAITSLAGLRRCQAVGSDTCSFSVEQDQSRSISHPYFLSLKTLSLNVLLLNTLDKQILKKVGHVSGLVINMWVKTLHSTLDRLDLICCSHLIPAPFQSRSWEAVLKAQVVYLLGDLNWGSGFWLQLQSSWAKFREWISKQNSFYLCLTKSWKLILIKSISKKMQTNVTSWRNKWNGANECKHTSEQREQPEKLAKQ